MRKVKWFAALIAGSILVTAWAQTTTFGGFIGSVMSSGYAEPTTWRQLVQAEYRHREYVRADSLLPLMPDTPGVMLSLSPLVRRPDADSIRAMFTRETWELPESRSRVGVFLVDSQLGMREHSVGSIRESRDLYIGSDSSGTYCAIIAAGRESATGIDYGTLFEFADNEYDQPRRTLYGRSMLGPCAFIAKYGAPGAPIARWLRNGGYRFASVSGSAAREIVPRRERPGRYVWLRTEEERLMRGCRAGRTDLCTAVALLPTRAGYRGLATFAMARNWVVEDGRSPTLMHDLEQQFGAERFAQFWTSESDVPNAFRQAFGTDIGTWIETWSTARWGSTTLGARVDPIDQSLSLLFIAAFAGISMVVATRRQI